MAEKFDPFMRIKGAVQWVFWRYGWKVARRFSPHSEGQATESHHQALQQPGVPSLRLVVPDSRAQGFLLPD